MYAPFPDHEPNPPYDVWGTVTNYLSGPSTLSKIKDTTDTIKDTSDTLKQVFANPQPFFEGVTKGVLKGMGGEQTENKSLFDQISQLTTHGISKISVSALEILLKNSETHELDEEDANLRERALATLKEVKEKDQPLPEVAKDVWGQLDKYHLLFGGVNLSIKTSANEKLRNARAATEKNNDGVTPIHSLVRCQNSYTSLRTQHKRICTPQEEEEPDTKKSSFVPHKLTVDELKKLKELETKTDDMRRAFAEKTVHFAAMNTIHYIFDFSTHPSHYKKLLTEGGDIEKKYLKQFGKKTIRYYFYKMIYGIIIWFIRPVILPTIENVVEGVRSLLRNEVDVLKVVEQKINDMTSYYGRIELGRKNYLYAPRTDEAGTLDEFLVRTIKKYGDQEFTEEQLISIFNEYVVQNFIPSAQVTAWGYRIPLISSILEWIVNGLRKAIVGYILQETGIVEKMLTEGSSSVQHAQLGLKSLIQQRLTQIVEMIDRARGLDAELMIDPQSKLAGLASQKKQFISQRLHLSLHQHSQKLMRFIDNELCNGDERKLRHLDNKVTSFVAEAMQALSAFGNWEPLSLEKVLEDACTDLLETSLISLFDNKETQIETQLQTVFEVLDKTYSYVPENKEAEIKRQFEEECARVDENLTTLQNRLVQSAASAALENHLKNASGERHKAIKAYVQKEQENYQNFADELTRAFAKLQSLNDAEKKENPEVHKRLSEMHLLIENYLKHITTQLHSQDLQSCYSDVKGDLHNLYSVAISALTQISQTLEKIASNADLVENDRNEIINADTISGLLDKILVEKNFDGPERILKPINSNSPLSIKAKIAPDLKSMTLHYKKHEEIKTAIAIKKFDLIFQKVEKLGLITKEYRDLAISKLFPTEEKVQEQKEKLEQQIKSLRTDILESKDSLVEKHIFPHLKDEKPSKLYKILHSSMFRSRIPAFAAIDGIKDLYKQKLSTFPEEVKSLDENGLTELQKRVQDEISNVTTQITKILKENSEAKRAGIENKLTDIATLAPEIGKQIECLNSFKGQLDVKGCISVGEVKLLNNLAPRMIGQITPLIADRIKALTIALGKPFHYKQLMLRLLFLDIARRQKN